MRLDDYFKCCFRGPVSGESGKKVRNGAKGLSHQLADQMREGEIQEAGLASPSPPEIKPSNVASGSAGVSVSSYSPGIRLSDWERGQLELEEHRVRDEQEDLRRASLHGWFERRRLADERKKALELWRVSGKLTDDVKDLSSALEDLFEEKWGDIYHPLPTEADYREVSLPLWLYSPELEERMLRQKVSKLKQQHQQREQQKQQQERQKQQQLKQEHRQQKQVQQQEQGQDQQQWLQQWLQQWQQWQWQEQQQQQWHQEWHQEWQRLWRWHQWQQPSRPEEPGPPQQQPSRPEEPGPPQHQPSRPQAPGPPQHRQPQRQRHHEYEQ
ncbi:putative mediator of RNA polymerase II transcription subunit 26 [Engraulis encrasicolus]|uniref:putative mediator of RNA polymerase II transcription subunit 26 n=1 Tax=Engraulis encrasicolus TaxID=184585 RepID=UPI002FD48BB3